MKIRPITPADNAAMKAIIQRTIHEFHNDIPGSPYFDPQLGHLSDDYQDATRTAYWVVENDAHQVMGGGGLAPFGYPKTVELQKLYLLPEARGQHCGHRLIDLAQQRARELGYQLMYIETFSNYVSARGLYKHLGFQPLTAPLAKPAHPACDTWYVKKL